MILREISTVDEIRLYWPLTDTEIDSLVQQDKLRKRLVYFISMSGNGPNHFGSVNMSLIWVYLEPNSTT